jgi:hypothetical protein
MAKQLTSKHLLRLPSKQRAAKDCESAKSEAKTSATSSSSLATSAFLHKDVPLVRPTTSSFNSTVGTLHEGAGIQKIIT